MMGQCILTHHDGVVDDDAQGHDQGEQADHVYAASRQVQDEQGSHEGDRNAHRHPPGNPSGEKQVEYRDHQHQAPCPVFHQQHDAIFDKLPGLVVDLDLYIGGQCRNGLC